MTSSQCFRTFDRVIDQVMVDAARVSGRQMPNTRAEQDLWDAIAERMRSEMVGPLVHGCPWRIAREVFDEIVVVRRTPVRLSVADSPAVTEPLQVAGFLPDRLPPSKAA